MCVEIVAARDRKEWIQSPPHPPPLPPPPPPPVPEEEENCDKRTVDRVVKFAEHYQLNYMHCANLKPFHIIPEHCSSFSNMVRLNQLISVNCHIFLSKHSQNVWEQEYRRLLSSCGYKDFHNSNPGNPFSTSVLQF